MARLISKARVRKFMLREIADLEHSDLWDRSGHVNLTRLAENAAWHFDRDEWLDEESHWVWELAMEVADAAPVLEPDESSGTGLNNCRSPFGYGAF